MSLKAAKAKRAKITKEAERRRRAAWERRFGNDLAHANEQLGKVLARVECLQGGQRVLLAHLERLLREKDSLVQSLITGEPPRVRVEGLPDDFHVQPIHRVAAR